MKKKRSLHDQAFFDRFARLLAVNGTVIMPVEATVQELLERFKDHPEQLRAILEDAEDDSSILGNDIGAIINQLGGAMDRPLDLEEAPKPKKITGGENRKGGGL